MGFNHQTQRKVLDSIFAAASLGAPATLYFALFTAAPTNSGGGTEATYTSYARVSKTANATNFPAASGGDPATIANGTAITFPSVGSGPQTVVAVAAMSASSGGTMWAWMMLDEPKVLNSGDAGPEFAIGELTFQMTGV